MVYELHHRSAFGLYAKCRNGSNLEDNPAANLMFSGCPWNGRVCLSYGTGEESPSNQESQADTMAKSTLFPVSDQGSTGAAGSAKRAVGT